MKPTPLRKRIRRTRIRQRQRPDRRRTTCGGITIKVDWSPGRKKAMKPMRAPLHEFPDADRWAQIQAGQLPPEHRPRRDPEAEAEAVRAAEDGVTRQALRQIEDRQAASDDYWRQAQRRAEEHEVAGDLRAAARERADAQSERSEAQRDIDRIADDARDERTAVGRETQLDLDARYQAECDDVVSELQRGLDREVRNAIARYTGRSMDHGKDVEWEIH